MESDYHFDSRLQRSASSLKRFWLHGVFGSRATSVLSFAEEELVPGAGLDVFDIESPLPADHPILKAPNTVLVPHIGFETFEAMSANGDIAMRDLEDFLSGHSPAS